jgi:hypothetical protein
MSEITTLAELKSSIQVLEMEQAISGELLKRQFTETYELFRPVNLIRNAVRNISTPLFLLDKLLGPVLGLAAGFIFKK